MSFPHRTYCDTLHEMREIVDNLNFLTASKSKYILKSLIEECQTYGNRMEAALAYGHNIDRLHEERKELEEKVKELRKEVPEKQEKGIHVEHADISELFDD